MSEMWYEGFDSEKRGFKLLDNLDTLFEAATLKYMNNDKKMVEWLFGESMESTGDGVLRVVFVNWATKRKILIEKPLDLADSVHKQSILVNEKENVAFMINISDIVQRDLTFKDSDDVECPVACLQIEVYKDGRISVIFFGRPGEDEESVDEDEDDSQMSDYDDSEDYDDDSETQTLFNGLLILGASRSEEGFETHESLEKIIHDELSFDYWIDDFRKSFDVSIDDFTRQCSENDS